MKVGIFNKKLWKNFSRVISCICGIFSFVIIFIDIPADMKIETGLAVLAVLCAVFAAMLVRANCMSKRVLKINNIEFTVKYGDLFAEQGLKTITFNEYFDTKVDEAIISSKTINGFFLNNKVSDIAEIDELIENDSECRENIVAINDTRPDGKKIKYKLGTAVRYGEYILVAFSRFDEHNQAYLSLADYLSCLAHYWEEVNQIYNGENIVLPLLGTGITRFKCGNSISGQRALEMMIQIFEYNNLSFAAACKITLVISPKLKNEINLYDIG